MPDENDPNRTAALAALKRGDAPEAIRSLTEAVRAAPEDAELAGFLGVAYGMDGDLDAAVFWLRKATQLGPNSAPAFYNLGGALERAGQPQEAIGAYRRALVLEPQHPRARAALARMESVTPAPPAIPSPFPQAVPPIADPFPAPPPVPAAPETAAPETAAAEPAAPEAWSCRCGSANTAGYAFCPRCGAPAPAPETIAAEAPAATLTAPPSAETPEATAEAVRDETPRRRLHPAAVALVALPLLVAVGYGLGRMAQGPQPSALPSGPAINAPEGPPAVVIPAPPPQREVPPPAAPHTGPGLGLTRDQVTAFLERDINWAFQESTDEAGRPRLTGQSADGLTEVEMIGHPDNLESVYLAFDMPPDEAWSPNLPNGRRVEALFEEYAPGSSRWVLQNMEELLASGTDGERREAFANRTAHLVWNAARRRGQAGITAQTAAVTVTPAPEENWLEDLRKIPLQRRYRFVPLNGGDAIVGTLLKNASDIFTVRLDSSGESVELHQEDGYFVEPVEPTDREREWLRQAEEKRRNERQAALRRNYVDGRPLEVGKRYRFNVVVGEAVEGTLESLEEDLFHVRPDDGTESFPLRPENVDGVEAL